MKRHYENEHRHNRFVLLSLLLRFVVVYSYTIWLGNDKFSLRPYTASRDSENLYEMCKNVYGGTDDLPTRAQSLQEDPNCDFLVLEDEENECLVATGNLQRMGNEESIFIEGIRVSPNYEGKGIGTLWMRELIRRARTKHAAKEILSCTIDANEAMKQIFAKPGVDMVPVNGFRNPDWERLLELPGWNASTTSRSQNILEALQLQDLVDDTSKNAGIWEPIGTYEELQEILGRLSAVAGTIGHLPSIGKPMILSDNLQDSLQRGLVRKLTEPKVGDPSAVFALVRNEETSVKSDFVCSIVATNPTNFGAALWEACSPEYLPLIGEVASFPCIFEQPHPPIPFEEGSLQAAIPVQSEKVFINYRWKDNS